MQTKRCSDTNLTLTEMDKPLILIPAKGHSNRVPRKNLRLVGGKSLVAWAVERSVDSHIGYVALSTDDDEIASTFVQGGVFIIRRPKALAELRVTEVCKHAIKEMHESMGRDYFTTLILTLPTSPFITYLDLQQAYRQFLDGNRRTLFCITRVEEASTYLLKKDEDGRLIHYYTYNVPQKEQAYIDVGGMVIMDIGQFLEKGDYYKMYPWQGYEVDRLRAVDIDTEADLLWADYLAREVLPYGE